MCIRDSYTTNEIGVAGHNNDISGYVIPDNGRILTYIPNNGVFGDDSFEYYGYDNDDDKRFNLAPVNTIDITITKMPIIVEISPQEAYEGYQKSITLGISFETTGSYIWTVSCNELQDISWLYPGTTESLSVKLYTWVGYVRYLYSRCKC